MQELTRLLSELADIKKELKACLTELFDLCENRCSEKVTELEKEVEKLEAILKYHKDKKNEIIENNRL